MNPIDWNTLRRVHVIGVGGIGTSALARLLAYRGIVLSGCDRGATPVTQSLEKEGVEVMIGHDPKHLLQADLVIYSDAVSEGWEGYPELLEARKQGIPTRSYFEALGEIARGYRLIAVSGAHGKTTTTAMLIDVLEDAKLDPTAVVGSLRSKTGSNFRAGKGEYFIVEADEYRRHFMHFSPFILVILNIDADHLDYYRDIEDIKSAFRDLAHKIPPEGFLVCDPHHKNVQDVVADLSCKVVDYTKYFDPNLPLTVLSLHRINAAAALAVADILGIPLQSARASLSNFRGTWRRFEYKGETTAGASVYDDYAHHPEEIRATLRSVRAEFPQQRIIVAFHPHLYSRTKALKEAFEDAFADADEVVLAPIFAARETQDPEVSSAILARGIAARGKSARSFESLQEVERFLKSEAKRGDIVVTMGAGDIYRVAEGLVAH